jgi:hypothetical protein
MARGTGPRRRWTTFTSSARPFENPGFRDWHRGGFEKTLERARRARDFAGYFFAVQYYMAGFRDGHLGALT